MVYIDEDDVKKFELCSLIVLSLFLQIILIILGNQRKYTAGAWIRVVLWLAYLSANYVTTFSLGILRHMTEEFAPIAPVWAPFLLVHLGGPNTITAYSLEDNELWLRHFLHMITVVVTAIGICLSLDLMHSGGHHAPIYLTIPVFVSGIIKCGERSWALWSASYDHFGCDSLSTHDWDEQNLVIKKHSFTPRVTVTDGNDPEIRCKLEKPRQPVAREAGIYNDAYFNFKRFKGLYSDLIFSAADIRESRSFFLGSSREKAYRVIELELGFLYDVLYTKASMFCSVTCNSLCFISFTCTVFSFVCFLMVETKKCNPVDAKITYAVMVGAVFSETYAIIRLLSSDWTIVWLNKKRSGRFVPIFQAIASLRLAIKRGEDHKWSNSMAQLSLFDFCMKYKPSKLRDNFSFCKILQQRQRVHLIEVPEPMKEAIFKHVLEMAMQQENAVETCRETGSDVIGMSRTSLPEVISPIVCEWEFYDSLLFWHMATDLCYHADPVQPDDANPHRKMSKLLSDYMLYLLGVRPLMLPKGYGSIKFELARRQAINCLQRTKFCAKDVAVGDEVGKLLEEVDCDKFRPPSMLLPGFQLAKELNCAPWQNVQSGKWEVINKVWMDLLCFAAKQCEWRQHAQQLAKGGELLTHVSLLMAHLGLTDQVRTTIDESGENNLYHKLSILPATDEDHGHDQ